MAIIIVYRSSVTGWDHEPGSSLRKGERRGILEYGHWLPGGSLVPTVIVTSHAGMRKRGGLHALRQALPEH